MRIIIAAVLSLIVSTGALACDCMGYQSPEDHLEQSAFVFTGVALQTIALDCKVTEYRPDLSTTFKVIETLKGEIDGEVFSVVHYGNRGSNCGVDFTAGETYEIFAIRTEDGRLETSTCVLGTGLREYKVWTWDDYRKAAKKN